MPIRPTTVDAQTSAAAEKYESAARLADAEYAAYAYAAAENARSAEMVDRAFAHAAAIDAAKRRHPSAQAARDADYCPRCDTFGDLFNCGGMVVVGLSTTYAV